MATQKIEPKQLDFSDLGDGDVTNASGVLGTLKHNRAAGAAPTGSDNFAAGWAVGSLWFYSSIWYVCSGNGSWVQFYPATVSSLSSDDIANDSTYDGGAGTLTDVIEDFAANAAELQYAVLSGTVNGSNTSFTVPVALDEGDIITQNGVALTRGGVDYTDTATTIEFEVPPLTGDLLEVRYMTGMGLTPASVQTQIDAIEAAMPVTDNDGAIILPELASGPAAPSAGGAIFAQQPAERTTLAYLGPNGRITPVQPCLATHFVGIWQPPGGATTVPGVYGLPVMTVVGTATARTPAATNLVTRTKRLGYVSAATAGALASMRTALLLHSCGDGSIGGFYFSVIFAITDAATVAGARMFIGMHNLTTAPTNLDPATFTNCVGLAQLSGDATQLYICYGGSAAQTAIALGTNFPGNNSGKLLRFQIYAPSDVANTFYYQVDNLTDGHRATGTLTGAATVVPQSGTFLAMRNHRTNNATALAVAIDYARILIMEDY